MSIAAINWVAKQRVGNSNAKALLFWLAFHHNAETGLCCPGIKTLQAEMEVGSVNTVRTAMRLLKKLGFITAQPELKNGAIYRTLYTLNLDRISAEAPAIGDRSSQVEPPSVNEGGAIDVGGSAGDPGEGQQMTRGGSNGGRGEGQQVTPNREIEQGITGIRQEGKAHASRSLPVAPPPPGLDDEAEAEWNDLTARAALEADSMPEDVFSPDAQTPIENIDARFDTASDSIFGTDTPTENQNAAERKSEAISKPKRRKRVALTLTELPIDWRIYCEKTAPELNPDRVWDDFSDFWQNRAKDPFCVDWSRTWQTNIRKLHALPNNDFRKAPQLKAEIAQAAQAKPSRFMTAQERYEAELDRLGQISDEEYYARIDRAGEEFVRRDKERAARLAQEKAKKEKKL